MPMPKINFKRRKPATHTSPIAIVEVTPEKEHEDARHWLSQATEMARENVLNGGGPFGAILVSSYDDTLVFESCNRVTLDNDPTAHAEVSVIRKACRELKTFDLTGFVLYSSCEPCPMCLGASMWANIDKVYFNANRDDAEVVDFRDAEFYRRFMASASQEQKGFVNEVRLNNATAPFNTWAEKLDKTEY